MLVTYSRLLLQDQLRAEFTASSTGLNVDDLMRKVPDHERSMFSYWRSEEKRRVSNTKFDSVC